MRLNLFNNIKYSKSLKELKALENKTKTPLEVTRSYRGKGIYENINAKQVDYEISTLIDIVSKTKPQRIAEIGTYRGGTLYMWCKHFLDAKQIISIDCEKYHNFFSNKRRKFYSDFALPSQNLVFISGDTHIQQTADKLENILKREKLDFLFIDGDHTYEGVKKDFEMYSPFVRKGGLIAFHDILPRKSDEINVDKFWNEIKSNYENQEIVLKEGTYSNFIGIGVLTF